MFTSYFLAVDSLQFNGKILSKQKLAAQFQISSKIGSDL